MNSNNNMNAMNTIDARYSQFGGFLNQLDEKKATLEGKKLGKAIQKGLESELKVLPGIGDALTQVSRNFEVEIKSQFKSLTNESKSILNKFTKEAEQLNKERLNLEASIKKETEKMIPDQEKLVELARKLAEYEERANYLNDTAAVQKDLIIAKEERQRLINLELVALKEKLSATDKKAADEAQKRADSLETQIKIIDTTIEELNTSMAGMGEELKENTEEINKLLDGMNEKVEGFTTKLSTGLTNAKNTISSISTSINNVMDSFSIDKAIADWDTSLDKWTKQSIQMGNRWGTGYSNSDTFNSFKNDLLEELNGDEVGYSLDQMLGTINELADFSFSNREIAVKMASDLAFAKEYMGQSSESLHSMYALQVRTGQDDFLKKSLNTIAALQKTGNALSQDTMDAISKSSLTLTDKLIDMGMDSSMAGDTYNSLVAYAEALEKTTNREGDAQKLIDMFEKSLEIDNLATMVSSPNAYLNAINSNDWGSVFNQLMNSTSMRASRSQMTDGLSFGNMIMANEDVFGNVVNPNDARRISETMNGDEFKKNLDENLKAINENTDAVEDMKDDISETIPWATKEMQKNAAELAKAGFDTIAAQLATQDLIKTSTDRLVTHIDAAIGVLSVLNAIQTALIAVIEKNTLSQGLSGLGGKLTGGLKGLSKANLLTKLGKNVPGTAAGAGSLAGGLVAGVGITGGIVATGAALMDGFSVGNQGFKDGQGNRVEGTGGWQDGLAAAVTNQDLEASKGKDIGSGALKGAGVGAMIGTFIGGPVGTAIGGAIGAGVGALVGVFAHNRKEDAKERAAQLAEQKRQNELQATTAAAVTAIKNQRDVILSNRYDDNRYAYKDATTSMAGMGAEVAAPPITPSPSLEKGVGGTYRGVDIDGWSVTSDYEPDRHLSDGTSGDHIAIDFAKKYGEPIGAAVAGRVTRVVDGYTWRDSNPSQGIYKANYVDVLDETTGITYRYYHLSSAAVQEGQTVAAGNTVGYVGNTGHVLPRPSENNPTAGAHLHFATLKNGRSIDPRPYVTSNIFYANGTAPSSSSSSNILSSSNTSKRDAEAYSISWLPEFQTAQGDERGLSPSNSLDTTGIIKGLTQINDTLILIDKRQSDQGKILDALTNTPIQNLGV